MYVTDISHQTLVGRRDAGTLLYTSQPGQPTLPGAGVSKILVERNLEIPHVSSHPGHQSLRWRLRPHPCREAYYLRLKVVIARRECAVSDACLVHESAANAGSAMRKAENLDTQRTMHTRTERAPCLWPALGTG